MHFNLLINLVVLCVSSSPPLAGCHDLQIVVARPDVFRQVSGYWSNFLLDFFAEPGL